MDLLVFDRPPEPFDEDPEPFDEDIVPPGALPSMLMATLALVSTSVKARLVNCDPWSVLKISGRP